MNILYVGASNPYSTSYHRFQALRRLGHDTSIADPYENCKLQLNTPLRVRFNYYTGYRLLQKSLLQWVEQITRSIKKPDLIWIDDGELIGILPLLALKSLGCPVVLYNVDDPTGLRDHNRFYSLLKAISLYDLVVVVRSETEKECMALGAKQLMRVYRSYDELTHQPFEDLTDIPSAFRSEVAFIGTWMRAEKRDEFLLELIRQGIPVSIWGDRWTKSPYQKSLQPYYQGGSVGGRDYVAAIQGAKICLGLLSKGNRDLHTQRSLEVPYAGGLLCAERTSEHAILYKEGEEAVFWSNATECAKVCKQLLNDDKRRESIRLAGMRRVRELGVGNEDVCRAILKAVVAQSDGIRTNLAYPFT